MRSPTIHSSPNLDHGRLEVNTTFGGGICSFTHPHRDCPSTVHVADIPGCLSSVIKNDVLEMAETPYNPTECNGGNELVAHFDTLVAQAKKDLANSDDTVLDRVWTMRSGDQIFMQLSKHDTIRHSFGQMIHHRAQLGVYLRLLDIPIPGVYGPSAD